LAQLSTAGSYRSRSRRARTTEWASRCPGDEKATIEVRQVQEMNEFPPEVREETERFAEVQAKFGSK
jgi:hypothetical protein